MILRILTCVTVLLMTTSNGWAWGPKGHALVGEIADGQLSPNAKAQVSAILGFTLSESATWLDCVKSVYKKPTGEFKFEESPAHPEWTRPSCIPFMDGGPEIERMQDYVSRNWSNCVYSGGTRGCHESYHFADIAIQRDGYADDRIGAAEHDIVHTANAAIAVLRGMPSPSGFSIKDKKEAIFILAHLIGDMHQPLHVGSVYLDTDGKLVDPDAGTYDPATENRGGNDLVTGAGNFHSEWDSIPDYSTAQKTQMISDARLVPVTAGPADNWIKAWASEGIMNSRVVFADAKYGAKLAAGKWPISFEDPALHVQDENQIKRGQLIRAGVRLAQLLNTVWP